MSDFSRLEEKIAKLREHELPSGERRMLRGATPDALLAAILVEADETILPRRLTFRAESGLVLALAVANRRVQGILASSEAGAAAFAGRPIEDADEVRNALIAALAGVTAFGVEAVRLAGDDMGSDAGFPAATLLKTWGLSEKKAGGTDADAALSAFLAALGPAALAWIRIDGEEVAEQSGDPQDVERLSATAAMFLDVYLNRREVIFGTAATPRSLAIAGTGTALFYAEGKSRSAFVLAAPDGLFAVTDAWRASLG